MQACEEREEEGAPRTALLDDEIAALAGTWREEEEEVAVVDEVAPRGREGGVLVRLNEAYVRGGDV